MKKVGYKCYALNLSYKASKLLWFEHYLTIVHVHQYGRLS